MSELDQIKLILITFGIIVILLTIREVNSD